jgi:vancomycin permeability regulator SanA
MGGAIRRKLQRAGLVTAALVVVAFAGVFGSNAWVARAAYGRTYASAASVPSRSVAIVPGARVYGGQPLVQLRGRLATALMLYQGGRVKKILVSGNDSAESPEATVMSSWLRERGVAAADILVDSAGSRTRATMVHAAGVFDVRDAVICSQDLGTERSLYLASHAGIDAVAVATPTNLSGSWRWVVKEAFKTTLAFFESHLRVRPAFADARTSDPSRAARERL